MDERNAVLRITAEALRLFKDHLVDELFHRRMIIGKRGKLRLIGRKFADRARSLVHGPVHHLTQGRVLDALHSLAKMSDPIAHRGARANQNGIGRMALALAGIDDEDLGKDRPHCGCQRLNQQIIAAGGTGSVHDGNPPLIEVLLDFVEKLNGGEVKWNVRLMIGVNTNHIIRAGAAG